MEKDKVAKEVKKEKDFLYKGKPFNVKSRVVEDQYTLDHIHLRPEDAKKLEKKGFISLTASYKEKIKD